MEQRFGVALLSRNSGGGWWVVSPDGATITTQAGYDCPRGRKSYAALAAASSSAVRVVVRCRQAGRANSEGSGRACWQHSTLVAKTQRAGGEGSHWTCSPEGARLAHGCVVQVLVLRGAGLQRFEQILVLWRGDRGASPVDPATQAC